MKDTVNKLNKHLDGESSLNMLRYVLKNYSEKAVFTSSMSIEDQVITHLIAGINKNTNIITLDTGRMFYEFYDLIEETENRYNIKITIYFPDFKKVEEMVNTRGINLFYNNIENRKYCCNIRKIEPLKRSLANKEVWITGLRNEQSSTRKNLNTIEWDDSNNIIKVNPLLYWNTKEVWDYIRNNQIPYNPLHDKGYPSIGCQPCTRAIKPGEDVRAGRWWWENPETKECGLHAGKNKP